MTFAAAETVGTVRAAHAAAHTAAVLTLTPTNVLDLGLSLGIQLAEDAIRGGRGLRRTSGKRECDSTSGDGQRNYANHS